MLRHKLAALLAAVAFGASAQTSIGLSSYRLSGNHALDILSGVGLEASAVTFAADRGPSGTLFIVGDEGLGVVETTLTGQTISSMRFSNWPPASTNNDAEGLAYLGNGVLVVAEERLQDTYRFSYVAGGSVALASAAHADIAGTVGNIGTEGISYDPRDGSFVSVKQDNPQAVLAGLLDFVAPGTLSTPGLSPLFDADAKLGLASLSDVQTLSTVAALAGSAAADNLLLLSLDSRRLVEANRRGDVLGSLDLSALTNQAIEGVTIGSDGTIYLVAESSGALPSRLLVLTPVPEPSTWALLLGGLLLLGWRARRGRQ